MGNIISSKISGICGGSIDGVDDCVLPIERKLHTPSKKDEQQLLSPSPTTVGTSDVISDSSDMEDDETTSSFIGDISFDSLPLYEEEPQEVKQKDVSCDIDEKQLSSVATVILHHHLSNISDENVKLRKANSKFETVKSFLSEVILHVGDINEGYVLAELDISKGLTIDMKNIAKVLKDEDGRNISHDLFAVPFHRIPSEDLLGKRLVIKVEDAAEGVPLSDLYEMNASTRTNQKLGETMGMQGFVHIGELDDEETVNPTIVLTENIFVQGSIYGLSEEDMDRFRARNNEEGFVAQTIFEYVNDGTGLTDAEHAEFYPFSFTFGITPEVLKILDALAPVCRDDMAEDEKKSPEKSIVSKDSDEYTTLISNIAEAIGCDNDQREMLDENKKLGIENTALQALRDILGTLEIGSSSFKLEDGSIGIDTNEKVLWLFESKEEEEVTLAAKDLTKLGSIKLSGASLRLQVPIMGLADPDDNSVSGIILSYGNGIKVVGHFDSSIATLDVDFFSSDTKVKLGKVLFDFTSIVKVLDALDVHYLDTSVYYTVPALPDVDDE